MEITCHTLPFISLRTPLPPATLQHYPNCCGVGASARRSAKPTGNGKLRGGAVIPGGRCKGLSPAGRWRLPAKIFPQETASPCCSTTAWNGSVSIWRHNRWVWLSCLSILPTMRIIPVTFSPIRERAFCSSATSASGSPWPRTAHDSRNCL